MLGLLLCSFLIILFYYLLDVRWTMHGYNYETENGTFMSFEIPWKGRTFDMVEKNFYYYKQSLPSPTDTVLYRTFKKNYLKFWRWREYDTHPRYKFDYKEPELN